jgi:hypothetical protein
MAGCDVRQGLTDEQMAPVREDWIAMRTCAGRSWRRRCGVCAAERLAFVAGGEGARRVSPRKKIDVTARVAGLIELGRWTLAASCACEHAVRAERIADRAGSLRSCASKW